jgi:3-dehydroquinate synthase
MTNSEPAAAAMPQPEIVRVELGERSYDIRLYWDALAALARDIAPFCPEGAFIISNPTVWQLHGQRFAAALESAGVRASVELIGDGERFKTLDTVSHLYDSLIAQRFGRRACIIGFGGGVVGDVAGFVAATFMRGVACVQVPTTVVAMVDSAVGGKTGVDHPLGKNLIGAFWQPRLVAADLALLRTLSPHDLHGGFAEVIKYGMIADADFFAWLEAGALERALALDPAALRHVVRRSCQIKAQVVGADERESGLRAILNYGHTFAHAIETSARYRERQFHGQAVAIGMVAAAHTAVRLGLFAPAEAERQRALIERAGLPTRIPDGLAATELLDRMRSDKKVLGGRLRFVLPQRIGAVTIRDDVPEELVLDVLRALGAA